MSPTTIVMISVGGGLVFFGILTFVIFGAVKRRLAQMRATLEREGIELDSGSQWITMRTAHRIDKTRGHLVLTRERLVVATLSRYGALGFMRSDLPTFTVSVAADGALHLATANSPQTNAPVELRVTMTDAAPWVKALTAAGAKAA